MTRYIEDLNENTAPVSGDYLLCYDASAGSTDKDRKVNVSKFAVLAVANTFTTVQTIVPGTTGAHGLAVNMPTSTTGDAVNIKYNNLSAIRLIATASARQLLIDNFDNGAGIGPCIILGYNNNGTAAAGHIALYERDGGFDSIWPDATGLLRIINGSQPTSATDTSGTVVGSQSSSLDTKNVLGEFTDDDNALARMVATPLYDFTYKSGAYNGERFTGIITDYAPTFGMDRDEEHPAGKSLNDITGFGYTVAAFKAVVRRLIEVERKLA